MIRLTNQRRAMATLMAAVAAIVVIWIVAVPPSAGPDEPAHIVRGAALIRGELNGERIGGGLELFELPAHIAFPDPGCYAFVETTPVTCATQLDVPTGDAMLATTAGHYPIWGHVPAGIGSLLPAGISGTATRLLDAAIPMLLLGLALFGAARRGWLLAGAVLLGSTVPVWFMIAVVNPSGYVITGAFALWVTLSGTGWRASCLAAGERSARLDALLLAAGWAAMVLPRRDGLLYAALILALAILIFEIPAKDLLALPRWVMAVVAGSTLATLGWVFGNTGDSSPLLFAAVLLPGVALVARRLWGRFDAFVERIAMTMGSAVVVAAGSFVVMAQRARGFDTSVLQAVIGQTGTDLNEAVGVVGWLDTQVPRTMVMAWFVALGVLAAAGVAGASRRHVVGASGVLGTAVLVSWVLTMNQNDSNGLYWQGRYYLPLLVGIPVVLGVVRVPPRVGANLGRAAGAVSLTVLTVGLAAAMRRWGVGAGSTMYPWRWDTYGTALPPVVLLILHGGAAAVLWASIGQLVPDLGLAAGSGFGSGEGSGEGEGEGAGSPSANWGSLDDRALELTEPDRLPAGVNLLGYHRAGSGLGHAVRTLDAALTAAGVEVSRFEVALTDSPQEPAVPSAEGQLVRRSTIAVVTAPELPAALAAHPELSDVERVIGYWFWEVEAVPDHHRGGMNLVDEIWAPTRFVEAAYQAVQCAPPVVLQPLPLIEPTVEPALAAAWRQRLVPDDEFMVLVTLDLFSVVERKNPFAAIDAFALAAASTSQPGAADRPARLVIKTLNGAQRPRSLQRIVDHVAASPVADRITILDEFVSDADMLALIASADCLLSLHRGEGLGLPLVTAMWIGTPVIATRYSGNLDFMDDENSMLVDFELVAATEGEGAYDGTLWADADISDAGTALTRLINEPALGERLAAAARASMMLRPGLLQCGQAYEGTLSNELGDAVEPAPDFNIVLHHLRTQALAAMPAGAQRLLSVGCAGRWYFDWIADAYGPVAEHVGIEFFSPEPDDLPDYVTWIADTASNMASIADSSADMLFSGQNIEHLWPVDVVGFLAESNRVLRSGGTMVIDSPNRLAAARLGWSQPEHTVEFTAVEIVELATLAGFSVTRLVGLWDCAGHDRLEPVSVAETAARAGFVPADRIDDAFVWWLEAELVGPCDTAAVERRVEEIFAVAWPERMHRRVINERATPVGAGTDPDVALPVGEAGVLVHGPHAPLSAGSYQVGFDVTVDGADGEHVGYCMVHAGHDRLGIVDVIASGRSERRRLSIDIELDEMTFGLHGRIDVTGSGSLAAQPAIEFTPARPVGH